MKADKERLRIDNVFIPRNSKGECTGFAVIRFVTEEDAVKATTVGYIKLDEKNHKLTFYIGSIIEKSMKLDEAEAPKRVLEPLKHKFTTAEEFMNNVYPMISAERAAQRKQAEESKTIGRISEVGSNLKGQHTLTFTLPSIFSKNGMA
ncbi:hypothetical protein WR25_13184 [Diploscapter pachys]|uniref:RRM domain-containing protein n=1 Tax=Diploscapter pachys TaxID=2018661 RepID=A0A2A2M3M5_9BILA|nr:hypothetical protein WR25_13184 [Diploscapter pachys]